MRNGFLGSITILLTGVGLTLAQPVPSPMPPADWATTPGASPYSPASAVMPAVVWQGSDNSMLVPAGAAGAVVTEPPRSPYWPVCPATPPAVIDVAPRNCQNIEECIWGSAEYLAWWVKDGPLNVPLVTTSGAGSLGILGNADTSILLGNSDLNYKAFSGARFTAGIWLDKQSHSLGVEGSGFFTERRTTNSLFISSVTGAPLLARPFFNPMTGAEDSVLVSAPGQFAGDVGVGSSSALYGFEVNLIRPNIYNSGNLRLDFLAGLRYLNLAEDLGVLQTSTLLAGGLAGFAGNILTQPATLDIVDRFQTRNEYYGGQFGVRGEWRTGRFYANGRAKFAFGNTYQVVSVDGATSLSGAAAAGGGVLPTATVPGGVLAVSSNIGRSTRDRFGFVPEFGLNVGYNLKQTVSIFMGYTFLCWTDVARPGDQVTRTINPTQVPSSLLFGQPTTAPAVPTPQHNDDNFWAQGLNLGVEIRY